jgi:hypothetical protein
MGVRNSKTRVLSKRSPGVAVTPPVEPMLAKLADELPVGAVAQTRRDSGRWAERVSGGSVVKETESIGESHASQ